MKHFFTIGSLVLTGLFLSTSFSPVYWGFFGHRKINRLAVYTLPQELIPLYKEHIEYITEHAIDPDKRRYATKREAPRHYIDIDHWGEYPFENLPRDFTSALVDYSNLTITDKDLNQHLIYGHTIAYNDLDSVKVLERRVSKTDYRENMRILINRAYFDDEWDITCEELEAALNISIEDCQAVSIVDSLSEFGIAPYYLWTIHKRLQTAFEARDINLILRYSAEFGHYISDAHVPLHTTKNYNGQLTGQDGIHAFWESRIPELFAEKEFDLFVGAAEYIDDPKKYFWEIIFDSHALVDSVLAIEKRISKNFPSDLQYCYEERLDRTIRTQCTAYAEEYNRQLGGMVEKRMQDAILAVGSLWYTAWVDAGQPDVRSLGAFEISEELRKQMEKEEALFREGNIIGRDHN